jgi:CHAD domain-containing protein
LHQMRVATRRLRAVLRAARPVLLPDWAASLQSELSWLGRALGPARDLDVQIAHFTEAAAGLDASDRTPLARLVTQLRSQREHVHQVLLTELNSARYVELISRLRQAAHDPAMVESPLTLHDLASQDSSTAGRRQLATSRGAALHKSASVSNGRGSRGAAVVRQQATSRFIKRAGSTRPEHLQDALQAVTLRAFLKAETEPDSSSVAWSTPARKARNRSQEHQ